MALISLVNSQKAPAGHSGESRHNPLIGRTKTAQRPRRFYLAVRRYQSYPIPHLFYSAIVTPNRHGREGRFRREFRAGDESWIRGQSCVINMPAMSATSSSSRFYVLWPARTGRSASPGTMRPGTMDARTDDISNGATKRLGVCSMKSFMLGSRRCRNAASMRSNGLRFGRKECCSIREPMPSRFQRTAWAMHKRGALDGANIVFLDPDNGVGAESEKHATFTEIRLLRRLGRAVVFITFPGRNLKHDALLRQLHKRLAVEVGAGNVITLRTNVSVPRAAGSRSYVQRQRWFTVVEPDAELTARAQAFAIALASVPRVRALLESTG